MNKQENKLLRNSITLSAIICAGLIVGGIYLYNEYNGRKRNADNEKTWQPTTYLYISGQERVPVYGDDAIDMLQGTSTQTKGISIAEFVLNNYTDVLVVESRIVPEDEFNPAEKWCRIETRDGRRGWVPERFIRR